jgi:hypothetical protein
MLLTPNKEGIEPRVPSGSNLKTSLQKCYGRHHDLVNLTEHLCQKRPRICLVCRNRNPVVSSFMKGHYYGNHKPWNIVSAKRYIRHMSLNTICVCVQMFLFPLNTYDIL